MKEREEIVQDAESRQLMLDLAAFCAGVFPTIFAPDVASHFGINHTLVRAAVGMLGLGLLLLLRFGLLRPNRYVLIGSYVAVVGFLTAMVMKGLNYLLPGVAD